MAEDIEGLTGRIGDLNEEMSKFTSIGSQIYDSVKVLHGLATDINTTFGQMKQRISETVEAIAMATPELNRMGGTAIDATKAIQDISLATRKNVVASTESVTELFATSKVLGVDVNRIVESMTDVGVQFGNVQENLIGGVNYVQSIGMNVGQIMRDVVNNTELLNRFNFEGGVMGLTKMAAQAAMLRVDMSVVQGFAERVIDPEGAIKMAAAFQRLGVNVGALADPFALMNASINDPEGLQKSIAEMTQRYTYFDEKTKSFRIDPEGVRFLREISKETGISYDNLSKMGLAAANSDRIMSQMRFGGQLSEEQKMYVASMAQLSGSTGEYVIKVKDETGKEYYEKLEKVSEDQLKATIKAQQEAPKSMEDIARAQLTYNEQAAADIASIRNRIVGGVTAADQMRELPNLTGRLTTAVTEAFVKLSPTTKGVKEGTEKAIDFLQESFLSVVRGQKSFDELGKEVVTKLKNSGVDVSNIMSKMAEVPEALMDSLYDKFKGDTTGLGAEIKKALAPGSKERGEFTKGITSVTQLQKMGDATRTIRETKQVTHSGTVKYVVELQGGSDPDLQQKFSKFVESPEFSQMFVGKVMDKPDATGQTIKVKLQK